MLACPHGVQKDRLGCRVGDRVVIAEDIVLHLGVGASTQPDGNPHRYEMTQPKPRTRNRAQYWSHCPPPGIAASTAVHFFVEPKYQTAILVGQQKVVARNTFSLKCCKKDTKRRPGRFVPGPPDNPFYTSIMIIVDLEQRERAE